LDPLQEEIEDSLEEIVRSDDEPNVSPRSTVSSPATPVDPMNVVLPQYIPCVKSEAMSIPSDTMDPYLLGRLKHESLYSFLRQAYGANVRHNERKDALIRRIVRLNANRLKHQAALDKQRIDDLEIRTDRLNLMLAEKHHSEEAAERREKSRDEHHSRRDRHRSNSSDRHQRKHRDERHSEDRDSHRRSKHRSRSKSKTSRSVRSHRHGAEKDKISSPVPEKSTSKSEHGSRRSRRAINADIAAIQNALALMPQMADIPGFMDEIKRLYSQPVLPPAEITRQVVNMINETMARVNSENLVQVTAEVNENQSKAQGQSTKEQAVPIDVPRGMPSVLHSLSLMMRNPFAVTTVTTAVTTTTASVVTTVITSTVPTQSVTASISANVPLHSTARKSGLLPIPPDLDVSELPSTPLSVNDVLPRGLVRNESRIQDRHRSDRKREDQRKKHKRRRHRRDTPARDAGFVGAAGVVKAAKVAGKTADVRGAGRRRAPDGNPSSSSSSSSSDSYRGSGTTSDNTYVPRSERSRRTSSISSRSNSFSHESGTDYSRMTNHSGDRYRSNDSRRSSGSERSDRNRSFTGSRRLDKTLEAIAQLQHGLQTQLSSFAQHHMSTIENPTPLSVSTTMMPDTTNAIPKFSGIPQQSLKFWLNAHFEPQAISGGWTSDVRRAVAVSKLEGIALSWHQSQGAPFTL